MIKNGDTFKGPSFTVTNRIYRVIWNLVYLIFFKFSPRPFHFWRSFLLRMFGAKVGKNVHVYPRAKIWAPYNLEIADEAGIANGVDLYTQGKISIGYRCIISQRSFICSGTHDFNKKGHPLYTKPIIIKDYAWVAAESYIGPGVTVGTGAIVGARGVVVKNVDPWVIVAGNPAKFIKKREILN